MDNVQKSRDSILAEREARKNLKLAAKNKAKVKKTEQAKNENTNLNVTKCPTENTECNTSRIKVETSKNSDNRNVENDLNSNTAKGFQKKTELSDTSKSKVDTSTHKIVSGTRIKKNNDDIRTSNTNVENTNKEADVNHEPVNIDESHKSKIQLKAERRALQEAQRARKTLQKSSKEESNKSKTDEQPSKKADVGKATVCSTKLDRINKVTSVKETSVSHHKVKLFSHLYKKNDIQQRIIVRDKDIHPSMIKLGLQYKDKIIIGCNARCVALLNALRQMIYDYRTPDDKDFSRGFENELSVAVSYLETYRPLSVSMTNALKHLKWHLMKLPNTISDTDGQNKLQEIIDTYIKEQIETARKAICITAQQKVVDGDVILTYGFSSLIEHILNESYRNGKKFKVIIVDSGPLFEGKELLRRLVRKHISCTYVLLSAVSYIMKEATKVFLGAHGLLTNGYVMSRAGTSQVALLAHSYNVPVLVCCETHKFSERVQTDAFVYNELGDPEMVMKKDLWQTNNYLTPLNLMYDVTPPNLVTAVITEIAILPCTSVPVVLRVKPTESILA